MDLKVALDDEGNFDNCSIALPSQIGLALPAQIGGASSSASGMTTKQAKEKSEADKKHEDFLQVFRAKHSFKVD